LQFDFGNRFPFKPDPMTTRNKRDSAAEPDHPIPLRQNVSHAIRRYLEDMGNSQPGSLYRTLLAEVEPPLLEEVLRYTQGNQSRTAKILGMTRNTLRSKLALYRIDVTPRDS